MLVGRPAEHTVLVISEERDNGTVTALTALLGQDGFPVINLAIDNLIGDSEVIDTAVASAIQDLISRGHAPKSLVYVHPEFTFQGGQFAQHFAAEKVRLQIPFFAAKYLQSSFNQYGQTERINFLCVTQIDGQLGWGRRGDTSILGRGLSGLVKSLNLEWSPVFCRYADIAPKMADKDKASSILAELWDADTTIQEVGVTEQGRTKLGTRLIDVPAVRPVTTKVTEQSVFLVSGGAKGVTAACVIAMAKTFKCKFILLGRSDFNFELPDYAQSPLEDGVLKRRIMEAMKAAGEQPSLAAVKQLAKQISAKLEIKDTLDKIKAAGSRAIYVQGDVTKATS
ncbi:MAG: short-chain dehydrogenase, partial [Bacteroidota bacterium]